jgi:hypothetical protein
MGRAAAKDEVAVWCRLCRDRVGKDVAERLHLSVLDLENPRPQPRVLEAWLRESERAAFCAKTKV